MNLDFLRISKGYSENEPALVKFEVLEEILQSNTKMKNELNEYKKKYKLLLKKMAEVETEYLQEQQLLMKKLEDANRKASNILAQNIHNRARRKEEKKRKVITKKDLLLGYLDD